MLIRSITGYFTKQRPSQKDPLCPCSESCSPQGKGLLHMDCHPGKGKQASKEMTCLKAYSKIFWEERGKLKTFSNLGKICVSYSLKAEILQDSCGMNWLQINSRLIKQGNTELNLPYSFKQQKLCPEYSSPSESVLTNMRKKHDWTYNSVCNML